MYTHSLWGTRARREHLRSAKQFWCSCRRCADPTEFGTNFSTLVGGAGGGAELVRRDPLDQDCPWTSEDGSVVLGVEEAAEELVKIGAELAMLQMSAQSYGFFSPSKRV